MAGYYDPAGGMMLRAEVGMVVSNFVDNIPNMSVLEVGYVFGYGVEKLAESVAFTRGLGLGTNVVARGIITADGFLFKGFTVKTPVNLPVQRFGNMSFARPDFWGARIGTNQCVNRTFGAIKPAWNPLAQYTTGVIPKGTPIKFGLIGPQGWQYPGGSLQFIVPSKSVINQSSKLILR